jgi:hypothetical protein
LFQSPFYRVIYSYRGPLPAGTLVELSCFNPLFTGSSIPTTPGTSAYTWYYYVSIPFLPGHLFLQGSPTRGDSRRAELFQSPFYRVIYSYVAKNVEVEDLPLVSIPFLPGHLFLRGQECRGRGFTSSFNPLFTGSSIPTFPIISWPFRDSQRFQSPFYRVIYSYWRIGKQLLMRRESFNPLFTGSSIPTGVPYPRGLS